MVIILMYILGRSGEIRYFCGQESPAHALARGVQHAGTFFYTDYPHLCCLAYWLLDIPHLLIELLLTQCSRLDENSEVGDSFFIRCPIARRLLGSRGRALCVFYPVRLRQTPRLVPQDVVYRIKGGFVLHCLLFPLFPLVQISLPFQFLLHLIWEIREEVDTCSLLQLVYGKNIIIHFMALALVGINKANAG